MANRVTIPLRLSTGLLLVGTVAALGYLHRSPWDVLLFGAVFTPLYAIGKWRQWRAAWRAGGFGKVALAVLVALPIQCLLVGVLYLLGFGLSALIDPGRQTAPFEAWDLWIALAVFVVGGGLGAAAAVLERHDPDPTADIVALLADREMETIAPKTSTRMALSAPLAETTPVGEETFALSSTPLTLDTFFVAPHRSHRIERAGRTNGALKPEAYASPERIADAEARLGVALPPLLREIYAHQNGGAVGWLMAPVVANPSSTRADWRGVFATDLCDLHPLEKLRTLRDAFLDHVPDDDEAAIPPGADRIIVVAERDMVMTCLDYSGGDQPTVLVNGLRGRRRT